MWLIALIGICLVSFFGFFESLWIFMLVILALINDKKR